MSEIINNSASTNYRFTGSQTVNTVSSNVLPINYDNATGLLITKNSNVNEFSAGDIITYTVNITNQSGSYLNGVRIIDDLGGGNLAYVLSSASLSYNGQSYPVTPVATTPLTFTLQQLPVGATMTLTYNAQVIFNLPNSVSQITNALRGIGYTASGTVNGYANDTIQKKNSVVFSINKSANATDVGTNEVFNYYLTIQNNSDTSANIQSITDNFPDNFNLISASIKIGSDPETTLTSTDYTISGDNIITIPSITGPILNVPAGDTILVTLNGYFA